MWTDDTMIFVDDYNECWALDEDCQTVCICQYEDVKKILSGDRSIDELANPKQKEAMQIILSSMEAIKDGNKAERFKPRDIIRGRITRVSQYREANIRQPKTNKTPTLHKANYKG